jgi:hypothetical protein
MNRQILSALALTMLAVSSIPVAHAAETATSSGWRQTAYLYGMGAMIDGETQLGDLKVPVDVSISDIFNALEAGAMGAYRIENDEWAFSTDLTYMGLGGHAKTKGQRIGGDVDIDQLTWMATGAKRLTPHLEGLFGFAYFDLSTDLKVRLPNETRKASRDADWFDPMLGLRYSTPFADGSWTFNMRGDIGGFGMGSDFMYHVTAMVHKQQTPTVGWYVGYRVIDFDYEEGRGSKYQRYNLTEQGPGLGVSFSF